MLHAGEPYNAKFSRGLKCSLFLWVSHPTRKLRELPHCFCVTYFKSIVDSSSLFVRFFYISSAEIFVGSIPVSNRRYIHFYLYFLIIHKVLHLYNFFSG